MAACVCTRRLGPLSCQAASARYTADMRKNYILDANILIHDPYSVFQFADNTVIIPIGVIGELDRFKKEPSDRGFSARAVVRLLDGLRNGQSLATGIALENRGHLRVYCEPEQMLAGPSEPADVQILRIARLIKDSEPETPVVIVTKDINLRIRADAAGLRAEDYESDHVLLTDVPTGDEELTVTTEQLTRFRDAGQLALPDTTLRPNEYVLLRPAGTDRGTLLARRDSERNQLVMLQCPPGGLWGIRPRNKEQYYAIDALLDERINLVSLMGKAGTGKTLLALAAALHLVFKKKHYRGTLSVDQLFRWGVTWATCRAILAASSRPG